MSFVGVSPEQPASAACLGMPEQTRWGQKGGGQELIANVDLGKFCCFPAGNSFFLVCWTAVLGREENFFPSSLPLLEKLVSESMLQYLPTSFPKLLSELFGTLPPHGSAPHTPNLPRKLIDSVPCD